MNIQRINSCPNKHIDKELESIHRKSSSAVVRKQNKSKEKYRWILLVLAVLAQGGGHIAFAFPAYFELQLKEILNIDTVQYNLLFTVQYTPNIVFPLIAGILPKKFGLGTTLIGFMSMLFLGQFTQFIALLLKSFDLLLVARLFVGIGFVNSQALLVVQITNWFVGKELGLSLSCQMMMGKVALAASGWFFSLYQGQNVSLWEPIFFVFLFGAICLIISITTVYFDYTEDERKAEIEDKKVNNIKEQSVLEMIKGLGKLYWLIITFGTMVNCIYFPFLSNVQLFLQEKYGITGQITSFCYLLPIFISAIFAPLAGAFCDYTGDFRTIWSFSSIFALVPFMFYSFNFQFPNMNTNAMFPVAMLGIFYGIANVIRQPSIRFSVHKDSYTMATGISISTINLGLFIFPVVFGYIFEMNNGVQILTKFLVGVSVVYLFGALYIGYYDMTHGNVLIRTKHHKSQELKK